MACRIGFLISGMFARAHTHMFTHARGSSKTRGKRFKSDMLTGEVFSVLSQISTRGAFFGLGADNFVRTCVVRNGIGRHGSYMIGDYTSLIVTFLIATVFPVLLAALAQNLERPVAGCR